MSILLFTQQASAQNLDYLKDIKPILKTHCVSCHGPIKSEASLRLDTFAHIASGGDNGHALVAAKPQASPIIQRVLSDDPSLRMPLDAPRLGDHEIALLKRWITEGATGPSNPAAEDPKQHWAFQPPIRPELPTVTNNRWNNNPIDAFISAKHDAHGLRPAKRASDSELLRRVYIDLIGLPPTREQLHDYLSNRSPTAFIETVDSLLNSPMYGERWGRHWLDVWRYSDWYGFQSEVRFSQKNIWHWRDWTIESLNSDIGYDNMVLHLLAGDEVQPFDPGNLRATGFLVRNRNTDSREQWIRDTIEHTSKALFGITMACAQCHNHPYDPVTQEEYYKYRNIFEPVSVNIDNAGGGPNGIDIAGVARIFDQNRNAPTKFYIRGNDKTPDEEREITPGVPNALGTWTEPEEVPLNALARVPMLRKSVAKQVLDRFEYEIDTLQTMVEEAKQINSQLTERLENSNFALFKDKNHLLTSIADPQVETALSEGTGDWSIESGAIKQLSTNSDLESSIELPINLNAPAYLAVQITPIESQDNAYVGLLVDMKDDLEHVEGCYIQLSGEQPGLHIFNEYEGSRNLLANLYRALDLEGIKSFDVEFVIKDKLINIYVNNYLIQTYKSGSIEHLSDVRLITRGTAASFQNLSARDFEQSPALTPAMVPAEVLAQAVPIASIKNASELYRAFGTVLNSQSESALAVKRVELLSHRATYKADQFKHLNAPDSESESDMLAYQQKLDELSIAAQGLQRQLALIKARQSLSNAQSDLLIKQSLAANSDDPESDASKALEASMKSLENALKNKEAAEQKLAEPPTPQYQGLPGSYGSSSGRRLSLANWLVGEDHPLTARVAINHIWMRHFNQPLVDSVFDFGLNGKLPTHPKLLDWLASEFKTPSQEYDLQSQQWQESDKTAKAWSLKHIHKLIVTSRTYQMASSNDHRNALTDSDNHLLWHRPNNRMNAEVVRDSVLHLAGELDTAIGGPSLPSELGMSVKRRSLYFHQSPEQQMDFLKVFDGVDPAECYRRHTSVVPHQSLALFNSELVIVQSRILARQLNQRFNDDADFITALFEHVLSRSPTKQEHRVCQEFLNERAIEYQHGTNQTPNTESDSSLDSPSHVPSLHARENLTKSLFNHHEFVTIP